jgi:histone demethylase JARID1
LDIFLCDGCDAGYHSYCLDPPIRGKPENDWHCPQCLAGTGKFRFEAGGVYSLKQFQEKANDFDQKHFANKPPATENTVEEEFWRIVGDSKRTIEVEYGADISSATHGSGFPTIEKSPRNPYSTDPWNLNVLPYAPESLFRHIRSDISGMTVPSIYVGMVFSTFCWHVEEHYTYSVNYQHFGATKTWYGIPAEDADKFEQALREAVPELFESQPDLLFQRVTLLSPERLKKAGVRVYALDQRAGEFVITFPQAYHAGFNHGFNMNEAVNFASPNWEPFGEHGIQRLQDYRRQPYFSHDELLLVAAARDNTTNKTAKWLDPALQRMCYRELDIRAAFWKKHDAQEYPCGIDASGNYAVNCETEFVIDDTDVHEHELLCNLCKTYSYLSRFYCGRSNKVFCLQHVERFECCHGSLKASRYSGVGGKHLLLYRMRDADLQRILDKAALKAWEQKMDNLMAKSPHPQLDSLRLLLDDGKKLQSYVPGLAELEHFVESCKHVLNDAVKHIAQIQQNRLKGERTSRKCGVASKNAAAAQASAWGEKGYYYSVNIQKLLGRTRELGFDCPEISFLRERAESIVRFQCGQSTQADISQLENLLKEGGGFNAEDPELVSLKDVLHELKCQEWLQRKTGMASSNVIRHSGQTGARSSHLQIPATLICDICSATFTGEYRRGSMSRHTAQHSSTGYLCAKPKCPKAFRRQDARLQHYRRKHPELVEMS